MSDRDRNLPPTGSGGSAVSTSGSAGLEDDSLPGQAWHIDWDERFRTHIPAIDAEHRAFVDLVNELNARIHGGAACTEVRPIVRTLIRDAETHFEHEERRLEQGRYPDYRAHAAMHRALLDRLARLSRMLSAETPASACAQIGLSIRDLLVTHMRYEDSKFSGLEHE